MRRFIPMFVLLVTLGAPSIARAQEAAPPPAAAPDGLLLNFQDAPLKSVLEYLSEAAGFVIIEEAAVQGRVTVMSRTVVSPAEAATLLNTVLTEQGLAAVRNGRVLRIVAIENAKKMNVPVRYGSDPSQIEATDEVITQVIPLRYADAKQVREDIASLIPSHADFSANESSNALILTDTSANVRRIVEIVRALDTHMATVAEVRVFQLTYANASDAAKLIGEVFKEESAAASNQPGGRAPQFFRGRQPSQQNQQDAETASRAPKVVASADDRTNTVVVSGPTDALAVVADVIKQLDANPIEDESVLVYSLKNATAENLAELMNSLFGQSSTSSTGALRTTGTTGRATAGGQQPAQAVSQQQRGGRFAQMLSQLSPANQASASGMSGKVFCVADTDTNTLLALTAPSNFDRLRGIIGDLDRPIPQVLIKVLIAELTWNDSLDVGAEFSILNLEHDGDLFSLGADFGLADATGGGMVYRMVSGDVTLALRALQENGKLDILSRPHILTSDNQTATITVGQEVPFIRNTRTTETGQTINTIEYEDIGIILEVTPHINPDGLVIMDVRPEISTTTAETVPISESVDAPVFAKRSAETRIAIKDNQTIVIGGLMQDSKTESIRKVPILGSIPLLGKLFSRTIKDTAKTELLIFLTPYVARDENELAAVSQREASNAEKLAEKMAPAK